MNQTTALLFLLILLSSISGCPQPADNNVDTNNNHQANNNSNDSNDQQQSTANYSDDYDTTIISKYASFNVTQNPICTENNKPVVFLFTTTWCKHCRWVKDAFDSVVQEYADAGVIAAYHWETNTGDNTLTDEIETAIPEQHILVYQKFSQGGYIPTFVFGCKYYRVGNGYESQDNLDMEKADFELVMDRLIE